MKFEIHKPDIRLAPYVKHLVISENPSAQTYRILPDTSLVIGFQYKGKLSYLAYGTETALASTGITGLLDSYRVFSNTANIGTVLVVFNETGAAHFFAQPLHELFGESISLDNFFSASDISRVEDELNDANTVIERINIVERFLINKLREKPKDLLVYKALQYIHLSKGTIRIADLAQKLHTSQSPLEKRFRREVGASPKKFAAIVRTKSVVAALEQNNADLGSYLSAYYDQAHFIKDFKKFTSQTPEQYLKAMRQSGK